MKPARLFPLLVKLLVLVVAMMVIIGIFLPFGTVKAGSKVFPLPPPMSDNQAHITDGIMAWGIIIVAIIFVGVIVGSHGTRTRQLNRPKRK